MSEAQTEPETQKPPVVAEVEKAYGTLEQEHAKLLSARPDLAKDLLLARKTIDEVMTSGATVLLKLWQSLAVVGFELTIIVECSIIDGVVKARELDAKWRQSLNLFVGIPYNLFAVHQLHPEPQHQSKESNQMSQPITEQVAAEAITKFIAGSQLIPDDMKQLFIGRVTNWEKPTVARMEDPGTCCVSVIKEADDTFSVVIGDQKWPIANCGTIGHTIEDGEEFQIAMKKVGKVNYRGFPGEFMLPTEADMNYVRSLKEASITRLTRLVAQCDKTTMLRCNAGKRLGRIVDEDDIQAIAAKERLQLLSTDRFGMPSAMTQAQKQERANFINSVAGFPRAPETT